MLQHCQTSVRKDHYHPPSTTELTTVQVRGSGGHVSRLAARRVHVGRGRPRAQRDPAPETRVPPRGHGGPALALLLGLGTQQRRKLDGREPVTFLFLNFYQCLLCHVIEEPIEKVAKPAPKRRRQPKSGYLKPE